MFGELVLNLRARQAGSIEFELLGVRVRKCVGLEFVKKAVGDCFGQYGKIRARLVEDDR